MTMNWDTLDSTAYANKRWELLTQLEESGDPKLPPYLDSVGIPTIGVGFNIKDAGVRAAVLRTLGFEIPENDVQPASGRPDKRYFDDIVTELNKPYKDTPADEALLRSRLDAVMARRAADTAISAANRTHSTFAFASVEGEIRVTFDAIMPTYERSVTTWMGTIPPFSRGSKGSVSEYFLS